MWSFDTFKQAKSIDFIFYAWNEICSIMIFFSDVWPKSEVNEKRAIL